MTKRVTIAAVAALLILVPATVTYGAHKPAKHKISATGAQRILQGSGNAILVTGSIKDKSAGVGATRATITTDPAKPNSLNVNGTVFFKAGSATLKGLVLATPAADGSTTYSGTLTAVSGTGSYKGVTGKLLFKGSQTAQDQTLVTYTATGTLTY
jgi:hypothetical protein